MSIGFSIRNTTHNDAPTIAPMVGALLDEIMNAIGQAAFHFDLEETTARLKEWIRLEKSFVFIAQDEQAQPIGFITLYEGYALYAEGAFGTIAELYVRPEFRSQQVGKKLLEKAKSFGDSHGWKRLEVTTPPLPSFDKTLAFYEKEGFSIAGGRKLKISL